MTDMDIFRAAERLMRMDDQTWARHANPWSVWTRFTCLPLLVLAIYSRIWIGWWALVPVAVALVWIWYNPRAFPPPRRFDTWAGKGTRGERDYLNRRSVPIPAHHARAATVLTVLSAASAIVMIWGLVTLDASTTVSGTFGTIAFKAWFVDRMVWLHEDMERQKDPNATPPSPMP